MKKHVFLIEIHFKKILYIMLPNKRKNKSKNLKWYIFNFLKFIFDINIIKTI
jgi:hypothetical protein